MKSIPYETNRPFLLRDTNGSRLIDSNMTLLFHENGLIEVLNHEDFDEIYSPVLLSSENAAEEQNQNEIVQTQMYSKNIEVLIWKMKCSFMAKQNSSYHCQGKIDEYLVQDTLPPYHQYVVSEENFQLYFKPSQQHISAAMSCPSQDDEGERFSDEDDDENRNNEMEKCDQSDFSVFSNPMKYLQSNRDIRTSSEQGEKILPTAKSENYYQPSQRYFGDVKKETKHFNYAELGVFSVGNQEYMDPQITYRPTLLSQDPNPGGTNPGQTFAWDLKQYSYFAFCIPTNYFSLEFCDLPISSHNARYRGQAGDMIVFNSFGFFLGVFSSEEFNEICSSSKFPSCHSRIHVIHSFRQEKILGLRLDSVSVANWNGTFEYGRADDYLFQFQLPSSAMNLYQTLIPTDSKHSHSPSSELLSCSSSSSDHRLLFERYEVSNHALQWIMKESEVRHFLIPGRQNSLKSIPIDSIPHYRSPFHIYPTASTAAATTCCWQGTLAHPVKNGKTIKAAHFIIYPDKICLIPLDSVRRKKNSKGITRMKYYLFADCTDIKLENNAVVLYGISKRSDKKKKQNNVVTFFQKMLKSSPSHTQDSLTLMFLKKSKTRNLFDQQHVYSTNPHLSTRTRTSTSRSKSMSTAEATQQHSNNNTQMVDMSSLTPFELYQLCRQCQSWCIRQQLYEETDRLFDFEDNWRKDSPNREPVGSTFDLSPITMLLQGRRGVSTQGEGGGGDSSIPQLMIEKILMTPIDKPDGLPYLHKLASYRNYSCCVPIMNHIYTTFFPHFPSLSPATLSSSSSSWGTVGENHGNTNAVNVLHLAIQSEQTAIVNYLQSNNKSILFLNSIFNQKLSSHSYLCYISSEHMFDLLAPSISSTLFTSIDSQGNTILMLLLLLAPQGTGTDTPSTRVSKSVSMVRYILQRIDFEQLLSSSNSSNNNETGLIFPTTLADYLNIQNWKGQTVLHLCLELLHSTKEYSNIIDLIQTFLTKNSDPTLLDYQGNNCSHLIAELFSREQEAMKDEIKRSLFLKGLLPLFASRNPQTCVGSSTLNLQGLTPLEIFCYSELSFPNSVMLEILDALLLMTTGAPAPVPSQAQVEDQQPLSAQRTSRSCTSNSGIILSYLLKKQETFPDSFPLTRVIKGLQTLSLNPQMKSTDPTVVYSKENEILFSTVPCFVHLICVTSPDEKRYRDCDVQALVFSCQDFFPFYPYVDFLKLVREELRQESAQPEGIFLLLHHLVSLRRSQLREMMVSNGETRSVINEIAVAISQRYHRTIPEKTTEMLQSEDVDQVILTQSYFPDLL
jgi:hypothetical protein